VTGELKVEDPKQLGSFKLLGRLGSGGMGRVFLGRSVGGRLVAVKAIRAELAAEPGFRERFGREVAAARKVSGLFTALVVDADVDGEVPWLATAYVAGPSLGEAVSSHGPLPVASVLTLAAGLAEALQAIHSVGVVHRDLKPSNVLLASDGPRVIDFGIARAAEESTLTQSGIVLGTAGFMSPEQVMGNDVGPPSDVFSLGSVLTFAAVGESPFGDGPAPAVAYRVVHSEPVIDHVPDELRPLVEHCLARDPGQRPTTSSLLVELGSAEPAADWLPLQFTESRRVLAPLDHREVAVRSRAEELTGHAVSSSPPPRPPMGWVSSRTAGKPNPAPRRAAGRFGHGPVPWVIGFLVLILTAFAVGGYFVVGHPGFSTHKASAALVTVPNVQGMSVTQATRTLLGLGFRVRQATVLSAGQRDTVVTEDPRPGTRLSRASTVTISARRTSKIPNMVGERAQHAKNQLKKAGYRNITIVNVTNINLQNGLVARQAPPPGRVLAPGTRITLSVVKNPVLPVIPPVVQGPTATPKPKKSSPKPKPSPTQTTPSPTPSPTPTPTPPSP